MSVTLDQIRNLIREEIARSRESNEDKKLSGSEVAEHVLHCPDCYRKVIRKSEAECRDCGAPLGTLELAKKLESCPWCGSKNAKEIPVQNRKFTT